MVHLPLGTLCPGTLALNCHAHHTCVSVSLLCMSQEPACVPSSPFSLSSRSWVRRTCFRGKPILYQLSEKCYEVNNSAFIKRSGKLQVIVCPYCWSKQGKEHGYHYCLMIQIEVVGLDVAFTFEVSSFVEPAPPCWQSSASPALIRFCSIAFQSFTLYLVLIA